MKNVSFVILGALLVLCLLQGYIIYRERHALAPKYLSFLREDHSPSTSLDQIPKAPTWFKNKDPFDDNFDIDSWDPFQEMRHMRGRMSRMFDDALKKFSQSPDYGSLYFDDPFSPDIDIDEDDDYYIVRLDVPGADDSKINVSVENRILRISGERTSENNHKSSNQSFLRQERWAGSFERSLSLPGPVDNTRVPETFYERGVLIIKVPKA